MTAARLLLAALLLGGTAPLAAQLSPADLDRVRALYLEAVREEAAVERGLTELAQLRRRAEPPSGTTLDATLQAYQGALITLRAKHGAWPPARLRHLRQGLSLLDAAVAAHPTNAEVRYLRLMSCFYLPPILGRGESVREDFRALAILLPEVRGAYPEPVYTSITRFVLENGRLPPERRRRLAEVLTGDHG